MNTAKEPKLNPRRARKAKLMPLAREYRRRGFTCQEIADALGIHFTTVWGYVRDIKPGDIYAGL